MGLGRFKCSLVLCLYMSLGGICLVEALAKEAQHLNDQVMEYLSPEGERPPRSPQGLGGVSKAEAAALQKYLHSLEKQLADQQGQLTQLDKQLAAEREHHNQRFGDLSLYLTISGIVVAFLGFLITGIVVFFAIRTTNEAKAEAKNEAQKEAREEARAEIKKLAESAIQEFRNKLSTESKNLIEHSGQTLTQMNEMLGERIKEATALLEKTSSLQQALEIGIQKSVELAKQHETGIQASQELIQKLKTLELSNAKEELKGDPALKHELTLQTATASQKEETARTFNDWRNLLLDAWNNSHYEKALQFARSAYASAETDADKAQGLTGLSVVLWQLGQHTEAAKIAQQSVDQYGSSQNPAVAKQVAKALRNKGVALVEQQQYDAAIAVYDDVIQRYQNRSEPAIAEVIRKASLGRLTTLNSKKAKNQENGDEVG